MRVARAGVWLLLIQLALVSSIAAKYLYQRSTCPRVWVKTEPLDPELVMRGRYLSLTLPVNACEGVRPASVMDQRSIRGRTELKASTPQYPAKLSVRNDKLFATGIAENEASSSAVWITSAQSERCEDSRLRNGIDFYLSETAKLPMARQAGEELWVEVTVPPTGPPRPLGLASKSADGRWTPLSYQ